MTSVTIVSLLPQLLGNNGDAANARVLAQRARWSGVDASVVAVNGVADLPERVDAVVIGTGTDSDLVAARDVLLTMATQIREWLTGGVPVLAVGTGWELLSWGIELPGNTVEGLGIVPGRAVPRAARATGDLVVATRYGRLIGFENHARDYVGAEGSPLGRVESGFGNGAAGGGAPEGVVMGEFVGTHLHGPVLARNPGLADHLVTLMLKRVGVDYVAGARSEPVDDIARAARNQIAVRLELAIEA
ncbi:cobyric acid synthase [Cryobacterium melibiosiphilum]|uniref:Lipid II isoglutaminyl synthase (glutamine-hydrolyzing) subunit GatD n=1 Tax=Cryobacterium melibiosiphilum TaxID=995039 RepID=A0A3A5MVK6_9MICO|nr:cobyric acid synthase [Cryobacterium melibiosiphilum]RJT89224.1 cobyric acid synthase [Cryobacterium melibiosiphilum]